MATCKNLEFTINSRVVVSDKTAERCMKLLEIYLDDNPEKLIEFAFDGKRHKGRIMVFDEVDSYPGVKAGDKEIFAEWDMIPVQDIPSYTGLIILEDYPGRCYTVQYRYTDEKNEAMVFKPYMKNMDGTRITRDIAKYKKDWRCWLRPMSEEARMAVKWK